MMNDLNPVGPIRSTGSWFSAAKYSCARHCSIAEANCVECAANRSKMSVNASRPAAGRSISSGAMRHESLLLHAAREDGNGAREPPHDGTRHTQNLAAKGDVECTVHGCRLTRAIRVAAIQHERHARAAKRLDGREAWILLPEERESFVDPFDQVTHGQLLGAHLLTAELAK
eukprot:2309087-Prymnesium_polylepis.1